MQATHIRVIWKNGDGTIEHEDLQLSADNETFDVVSIETLIKPEG